MTQVPLSDIATIHAGGRLKLSGNDFVPVGTPAYGAGGRNGYLSTTEYNRPGIILSSIGARCGKCFYVDGPWTTLANTQIILPNLTHVDTRYLWYQLNDERSWPRSGTGQPFIKPSDVKNRRVTLPSLVEQRRIAAILDQADALRTQRRAQLAHLDALPQAIFHEMFGHLHGSHPRVTLGQIARVKGGKRVPKGEPYAESATDHPYIRVSDIQPGIIMTSDLKYLTSEVHSRISRYTVDAGDVVITIAGTIGVSAPVHTRLDGANLTENAAKIVALRPDLYTPIWLSCALQSKKLQQQIRARTGQVTIGKLALYRIEQLELRLPPIETQRDFERKLEIPASRRKPILAAADEGAALFTSLQSRAFRGEL